MRHKTLLLVFVLMISIVMLSTSYVGAKDPKTPSDDKVYIEEYDVHVFEDEPGCCDDHVSGDTKLHNLLFSLNI